MPLFIKGVLSNTLVNQYLDYKFDPYWENVVTCINPTGIHNSDTFIDTKNHNLVKIGTPIVDVNTLGVPTIKSNPTSGLQITPLTDLVFSTKDFCIEAFLYRQVAISGYNYLLNTTTGSSLQVYFGSLQNEIRLACVGIAPVIAVPLSTFDANSLIHLAFTRRGNLFTIWKNGTALKTMTNPVNFTVPSNMTLLQYFNGFCRGLRITIGNSRYLEKFTIPEIPFITR